MSITRKITGVLATAASLLSPLAALPADLIEEIVVTSQRREQSRLTHSGNIDPLGSETVEAVKHQHMHELMTRVSGVWVSRGSGQEHLTAIRSPVLTGAGSCGAFLFLEDGIPIRPAGFCNVNSLFEINTEQAQSVEVIRGPGNALYGSSALHGTINVLMPAPGYRRAGASLEAGANEFFRASVEAPFDADANWLAAVVYADDGGFREDSGYTQAKLHAKGAWERENGRFLLGLTATGLDQETAGFIVGEDAYRDPDVNRSNPNPEAFREARSIRLYGILTSEYEKLDIDVRPFLRQSDMEFLQHFLPGQPLEENGHVSAGVLSKMTFGSDRLRTIVGIDLEYADIFLKQSQDGPTPGSPFLMETRPAGQHYDYDVVQNNVAAYVQSDWKVNAALTISGGLRADYLTYDYDNRMLDGNTRDDGTPCGFGGCLYTRPADRSDDFTNLAPKLALSYRFTETSSLYLSLARGFRAPQATELYRLQNGQEVADLDSEQVDAFEFGVREVGDDLSIEFAVFSLRKKDSVYRDSEGFNVTGARSSHRGIEFTLDWQIADAWAVSLDTTYARHQYDFDTVAARGETFVSGRDVDTAPRWLGSLELQYAPTQRFDFALQFASIGKYYLDAENEFEYPGHTIANLRAGANITRSIDVVLRLNNVTDRLIADRADYAFGNYRYFPGRGRELFAEVRYTPSESL